MRKLLSADFSRLRKSKVFWGLELAVFACGVFFYFLVWYNVQNLGSDWLKKSADIYFFFLVLYGMEILTAVFSSYYVGTEYSDGTIRNKLYVGHSRRAIYFSKWVVIAVVSVIFLFTYFLTAVMIGIPTSGVEVVTVIKDIGVRIGMSLVIVLAYTSLFTLTSMLDSNKARSVAVNIFLALGILLAGILLYMQLTQPEYTSRMIMQADGSYIRENGVLNPNYVSGTSRTLLSIVSAFLPSAQALYVAEGSVLAYGVVAMLVLTLVCAVLGSCLFQRKDIK